MRSPYLLLILILIAGCSSGGNKSTYTKEQIASLHLDNTAVLPVSTDSIETIDLNPFLKSKKFDIESLIDRVEVVPLETTDESLLDVIYKVVLTKKNIYIYDRLKGGGLVIFKRDGKFIRRLPYGQGPGELSRLYDIDYDAQNDRLIAYQHSFLLYFDADGKYIEQKRLPFGFYNFKVIPGGYVVKTLDAVGNDHLDRYKDYTLQVTDTNFRIKSVGLPVKQNDISYGGYSYLYNYGSAIDVTQRFVDTVYQYSPSTNKLSAAFALNIKDKKLPQEYLEGSMVAFERAIAQNDYYFYIGEYLQTRQNNVFVVMNAYTGNKAIAYRNKRTKNLIGGTHAVLDDIKQVPSMSFPIATFEDQFVSIHYPNGKGSTFSQSKFLTTQGKSVMNSLTTDDNPVLILYSLKEF